MVSRPDRPRGRGRKLSPPPVASLATEGELLANDVSKGASTKNFARVHARELALSASDFAGSLAKRPTVAGIESQVRFQELAVARAKVRTPDS